LSNAPEQGSPPGFSFVNILFLISTANFDQHEFADIPRAALPIPVLRKARRTSASSGALAVIVKRHITKYGTTIKKMKVFLILKLVFFLPSQTKNNIIHYDKEK
jgi:hypothetical protein